MKITTKQAVDQLQFASEKASDICRQLSFTVFAIAWIFRVQIDTILTIPTLLVTATLLATIVLMLDLVQYVYGVVSFQIPLGRQGVSEEQQVIEIRASGSFSSILFYSKIFIITIAYALILMFFAVRLL